MRGERKTSSPHGEERHTRDEKGSSVTGTESRSGVQALYEKRAPGALLSPERDRNDFFSRGKRDM